MAIRLPNRVVEYLLMGRTGGRRFMQDSPVLPDVWGAFAEHPDHRIDLLITPYKTRPAGRVAAGLAQALTAYQRDIGHLMETKIAPLQGVVAASLTFPELVCVVVPQTHWWHDNSFTQYTPKRLADAAGPLGEAIEVLLGQLKGEGAPAEISGRNILLYARYAALIGAIDWAREQDPDAMEAGWQDLDAAAFVETFFESEDLASRALKLFEVKSGKAEVRGEKHDRYELLRGENTWNHVFLVSRNRDNEQAVSQSVPAIKADAAQRLFEIACGGIAWAIVDSGIDGAHPAFIDRAIHNPKDKSGEPPPSRIDGQYDFTRVRQVLSVVGFNDDMLAAKALEEAKAIDGPKPSKARVKALTEQLRKIRDAAEEGRPTDWNLVSQFIGVGRDDTPVSSHGTHVAGILGADWPDEKIYGVCPDIRLYDLRVLGRDAEDTEFAVIAALQFVRHLNQENEFITIHGANLSLSIPHDVRNYACGRTPVCEESERLSNSGVVVVAAAGNRGYQTYETKDGIYEGYTAFSITDPGNADGVITVGATHRFWPHTYGISFFSSRGPTGDGRMKPDLVAPGEKITAPLVNEDYGSLDGTSMAAPHVSGAAAMLMARYSELIGDPRRVKTVLCETATDLDRERSFQGHGMLDVLRALQSV